LKAMVSPVQAQRTYVLAIRIIAERPNYHLFENNCQNFAKYLIEELCPGCLIPETIQSVLAQWQNASLQPRDHIPGTYPASVITLSSENETFITARENPTTIARDGNTEM
jgi:hypothetical protein